MKEINKTVEEVETLLNRIVKEAQTPVKQVLAFVKQHKKLIFTVALGYIVFRYLFNEEEESEEVAE